MNVGLQLYTVREKFMEDPVNTLKTMSEIGYRYAETYNHNSDNEIKCFGYTSRELRRLSEDTGVKIISAHLGCYERATAMIRNLDHMKRTAEYYADAGCRYLVLAAEYFTSVDNVYSSCEAYNKVGEICRSNGLKFLYHNHFWDFKKVDGKAIMDIIVEGTSPDLVGIQEDAYWVSRGMIDPIEVIHRYGTRVKCLHQKDFPASEKEHMNIWSKLDESRFVTSDEVDQAVRHEEFTEIGTGILDIQGLIDAGNAVNAEYVFLEQDYTKLDIFDSIRLSFENYKKMKGLEI